MLYTSVQEKRPLLFGHQEHLWQKGVDVIVSTGSYPDRETILQEAFDLFLITHPQLRLVMAIELYRNEVVTLARAAELADLNFFDFQAILRARGVEIICPDESEDEIEQGVALILGEILKKKDFRLRTFD